MERNFASLILGIDKEIYNIWSIDALSGLDHCFLLKFLATFTKKPRNIAHSIYVHFSLHEGKCLIVAKNDMFSPTYNVIKFPQQRVEYHLVIYMKKG